MCVVAEWQEVIVFVMSVVDVVLDYSKNVGTTNSDTCITCVLCEHYRRV